MLPVLLPLILLIAAPSDTGADILVIARKMRTVRLNYSLFGPHLKSCVAEVSSGDPRIDRIMCALLRKCIAEGNRELRSARGCVNRRIEFLEQYPQDIEYAPGDSPEPVDSMAAPSPSPPSAEPALKGADILVEGRRFAIRPGYWRFSEQEVASSNHETMAARLQYWNVCVLPGELSIALEKMLQTPVQGAGWGRCSSLEYQARDGVVTGQKNCITHNRRMTRRISRQYDAENVSLTQDVLILFLAPRAGGGTRSLDIKSLVRTAGKYLGDCPP